MSQAQEVGYAITNKDFLVYLDGMPSIRINDVVISEDGIRGWVSALFPDRVEILMIDEGVIKPGQLFKKVEGKLSIKVGEFLLGRAVNPLGVPIDGRALANPTNSQVMELEREALGVNSRQFITNQFITGISLVDTIIPIGKGQRELVIGDGHSGKTAFLEDLIINQKNTGTICIYTSIGKPSISVRNLMDTLKTNEALGYTIVIAAPSSDPPPLIFLAPQTAFTVAEYFQKQGKDVLVILDDLGNHAKIYRELSLLLEKSPGRESYPGDIFYQHSHLMERAGNFKSEFGGGSITAIPVIEVNMGDLTGFIPTNLMSMTDGHLLFKQSLLSIGRRPAIDISLSVSRVGRQTQIEVQNLLSGKIRQVLAEAESLETVSRFSSVLPYETQLLINQKQFIYELLSQESLTSVPQQIQILMLGLPFTSFLKDKNLAYLKKYKRAIFDTLVNDFNISLLANNVLKMKSDEQLIAELEKLTPRLNQLFPK